MYDAELQLRFMRSATDAFFEGAEAMLAASRAWQDTVHKSMGIASTASPRRIETMPLEPFAAWSWAIDLWRDVPGMRPVMTAASNWPAMPGAKPAWPMQAFQSNPLWGMTTPAFTDGGLNTIADPSAFWSSMIGAYWTLPSVSWALYQGPMTMMLVNSGLPYAVAAPTARASTAALDAADALRLQTIKTFSHFQTQGGHATAQIIEWTPSPGTPSAKLGTTTSRRPRR